MFHAARIVADGGPVAGRRGPPRRGGRLGRRLGGRLYGVLGAQADTQTHTYNRTEEEEAFHGRSIWGRRV